MLHCADSLEHATIHEPSVVDAQVSPPSIAEHADSDASLALLNASMLLLFFVCCELGASWLHTVFFHPMAAMAAFAQKSNELRDGRFGSAAFIELIAACRGAAVSGAEAVGGLPEVLLIR